MSGTRLTRYHGTGRQTLGGGTLPNDQPVESKVWSVVLEAKATTHRREQTVDPGAWQWIWLIATAFFVIGEIATPGSFFLLPFGVGSALATILAFAGAGEGWQWATFLITSLAALAGLRPLARRLNAAEQPARVGATRLIGAVGVVVEDLGGDPSRLGSVRIGREDWHAETPDGTQVVVGTQVEVIEIEGTRAVVRPVNDQQ